MEIGPTAADLKAATRRGTQDLGLLLLRLALGVVFIAHGLQKAFGWWGGGGLDAFKTTLSEAGYEHAGVLTYVGAGAQIAAGVLLVLGLFTPLAAAVALGLLVNSALMSFDSQRRDGGLLIFGSAATEYLLTLSVVAAVVILVGPGRYGFDAGRGWARRPFIGSIAALLLGIAGGVAAWLFRHGTNPSPEAESAVGLGTRPPLAAVNVGSVENVTAGSTTSASPCRQARAQPLVNFRPSTSAHGSVRLLSSMRAVTEFVVGSGAQSHDGHRDQRRDRKQNHAPAAECRHQTEQDDHQKDRGDVRHRRYPYHHAVGSGGIGPSSQI